MKKRERGKKNLVEQYSGGGTGRKEENGGQDNGKRTGEESKSEEVREEERRKEIRKSIACQQ